MAVFKALSITSASAVLIIGGIGKIANAEISSPVPLYKYIDSYTTKISANNHITDIYFPKIANKKTSKSSFPIALLLQGANVDKANYSNFARIVASYGFVVVVPNHPGNRPKIGTGLFTDTSQIHAVLAQMRLENKNPKSPVTNIVDTEKLGLLGHSLGGAVGLSAIANLCIPVLCPNPFNRPKELLAGAFFGTNLRNLTTDEFYPIHNSHIPVALIQGDIDSIALPLRAQATYEQIQNPPKALINILGVNHYGLNNTNNPRGARTDKIKPTLEQNTSIETVARWSALFLRASILDDKTAFDYVYSRGDALDPNVTVINQTKK
jgi:dienelactone hydrolase